MRRTVLAVVLALAVTSGWAVPASASAGAARTEVPGGFETWDELLATQQRLVAAADAITATIDPEKDSGLAAISAMPERRELWIYWKGEVPGDVAEVIRIQSASVPVRVLPARHSKAELLAAAAVVAEQPGVTSVGPLGDGSGLTVSTVEGVLPEALRALPAVDGLVLEASARRPVLASRHSSSAPHYGGAMFTRPVEGGNALCTTGFAVRQGRATRMLTAGHCGSNDETVYSENGTEMGKITGDNNTKDTMLVKTNATGRVYTNAFNSSTSKPVFTAIGTYLDTLVCTSGAMTGEHCKIRIKHVDLTINVGYLVHPVVEAVHDDHTVAAGKGDSGGPVVAQDSGGPFGAGDFVLVYPMGTITAIDLADEVPCGASYLPSQCAFTMYYVDITKSLSYYNATIVTG